MAKSAASAPATTTATATIAMKAAMCALREQLGAHACTTETATATTAINRATAWYAPTGWAEADAPITSTAYSIYAQVMCAPTA